MPRESSAIATISDDPGIAVSVNRTTLWRQANAILKADNDNRPTDPAVRIRNRSTRPAWNWLKKHVPRQAAALWLVARDRLPDVPFAANDNQVDAKGTSPERRKDGSLRGPAAPLSRVGEYLDLPGVTPRLGDAEPEPLLSRGWHSDTVIVKPRQASYPANADWAYVHGGEIIAEGATFIGANGLCAAKPGKSRGDARQAHIADWPEPPEDVNYTIELMLARSNLAEIGEAFGATGRYQDKKGKKLMRAAGAWAEAVVFERFRSVGDAKRAEMLAAA